MWSSYRKIIPEDTVLFCIHSDRELFSELNCNYSYDYYVIKTHLEQNFRKTVLSVTIEPIIKNL
jgi:hypothetical protein